MSWVITPTFVAENLEARNWVQRAVANGGSVSVSTQIAVSNFCNEIDNTSGLRSAITRLNLFCGDNLSAALVPLYLAESFGAAAKGNTTDTNNNFVSGDYAATGANGGLTGGGSGGTAKYLNTGLPQNQVGNSTSGHLSVSATGISTTVEAVGLGVYNNTEISLEDLNFRVDVGGGQIRTAYRTGSFGANAPQTSTLAASRTHLLGTRTSSTSAILYNEGIAIDTRSGSVTLTKSTRPFFVFGINNLGSIAANTAARFRMYSIGDGLTASQAAAFSTAVINFNTALGRT